MVKIPLQYKRLLVRVTVAVVSGNGYGFGRKTESQWRGVFYQRDSLLIELIKPLQFMNSFFIVLLLVAVVVLIVGLTSPEKVKMKSRKKVSFVFGAAIIVLFILIGSTSKTDQTTTAAAPSPTPTATEPATEATQTATPVSNPAPKKTVPAPVATPVVAPQPTSAPVVQQPTPAPQPITLLSITGSGSKSTQTFTVPTNSWQLEYTYDCSSFGTSGNFQVMVYNSDGSMSFDNSPVNELGRSGADTQYYHVGEGSYYLEVNSECSWTVNVKG